MSPGLVLESEVEGEGVDLRDCSSEVQMQKIGVTSKIRTSCMNNSVEP